MPKLSDVSTYLCLPHVFWTGCSSYVTMCLMMIISCVLKVTPKSPTTNLQVLFSLCFFVFLVVWADCIWPCADNKVSSLIPDWLLPNIFDTSSPASLTVNSVCSGYSRKGGKRCLKVNREKQVVCMKLKCFLNWIQILIEFWLSFEPQCLDDTTE